jgi:hypothetical protein
VPDGLDLCPMPGKCLHSERTFDMLAVTGRAPGGEKVSIMDTRETRNDKDAVEALEAAQLTVAAGQRELFAAIARCDHDQVWRANGCRDLAQWLSGRLGISNWAARGWVVAAHALERLPRLADAFQFGVLSVDKVCDLARFATPETEARLIRWARRVSPATVRRRADLAFRPDLQAVPATCAPGGTRTAPATGSRVIFRPSRGR